MLSYCLQCSKNSENENPKVVKTKKGAMIFYNFIRFIKEKEATGL